MMDFLEIKLAIEDELLQLCRTSADDYVRNNAGSHRDWIKYHMSAGPAYCGYYKGRLAGAAGLHIIRPGVANVWLVIDGGFFMLPKGMIPTVESLEYLEKVVWVLKEMRDILCRRFRIMKIRTSSRKGFGASQRLIKFCGFERLVKESKQNYYYIYRS